MLKGGLTLTKNANFPIYLRSMIAWASIFQSALAFSRASIVICQLAMVSQTER